MFIPTSLDSKNPDGMNSSYRQSRLAFPTFLEIAMVRSNRPPSDKLLLEAVELRTAGATWERVAEKVKRLQDQGVRIVQLHRDIRTGYKAGALE